MNDPLLSQEQPELQRSYYSTHADEYGSVRSDEHYVALDFMACLMNKYGLHSVLDVGAGTGRAVQYLLDKQFDVKGVEPVKEMIRVAELKHCIPPGTIIEGSGDSLPFETGSFDAVCAFGVMHHIKHPDVVIKEMLRVTRTAIFISDCNRFGQGSWLGRLIKLITYHLKLWKVLYWVRTGFKGFNYEGGLAFSYSLYDSYNQVNNWADRVLFIPTMPNEEHRERLSTWQHPLLTSSHLLLCGFKETKDAVKAKECN